ncbi:MAG: hypothetical protein HeimC3_09180 [Candidatus Heimdallarchaeota archaeon LC_3]|nr:MAG: hypothetical protein HeimC3_09180 [Candidatus Heimdallarchaeota archaeon LC_3]
MVKRNLNIKIAIIVLISIILFLALLGPYFFSNSESINRIRLATTTSTDNSGLLEFLHKEVTKDLNIKIDVIAVGTGAALQQARSGLADIVIVHARSLENQFISEGYGFHRIDLMFNDFVIVGPSNDPANIWGLNNNTEIFKRIYESNNSIKFISRGDASGTHIKELELWRLAGLFIDENDIDWALDNQWYLETGSGMGETLTVASELNAYTLTDRGTWSFMKEGLSLNLLANGSELWHNPYGAILVNPDKFNSVNIKLNLAKNYVKWLISTKGQNLINSYFISGKQVFFADFLNHLDKMPENEIDFWEI